MQLTLWYRALLCMAWTQQRSKEQYQDRNPTRSKILFRFLILNYYKMHLLLLERIHLRDQHLGMTPASEDPFLTNSASPGVSLPSPLSWTGVRITPALRARSSSRHRRTRRGRRWSRWSPATVATAIRGMIVGLIFQRTRATMDGRHDLRINFRLALLRGTRLPNMIHGHRLIAGVRVPLILHLDTRRQLGHLVRRFFCFATL